MLEVLASDIVSRPPLKLTFVLLSVAKKAGEIGCGMKKFSTFRYVDVWLWEIVLLVVEINFTPAVPPKTSYLCFFSHAVRMNSATTIHLS